MLCLSDADYSKKWLNAVPDSAQLDLSLSETEQLSTVRFVISLFLLFVNFFLNALQI